MKSLNLSDVINDLKLDKNRLALELFPNVTYPIISLNRIIKGEGLLNSDQVAKLSELTGISLDALFSWTKWKADFVRDKNIVHYTKGEYKAEFNANEWTSVIYKNTEVIFSEVMHIRTLTLDQYLKDVNKIISEYEQRDRSEA